MDLLVGQLYEGDSSSQVPSSQVCQSDNEDQPSHHTSVCVYRTLSFQQYQFQDLKLHFSGSPNYFTYTSYFSLS